MPTYDYNCAKCGDFEAVHKMTDPSLTECPKCGASGVKRLLSAPAFHLKGSGWYKTDYASSTAGGANGSSSTATAKESSATTASASTDAASSSSSSDSNSTVETPTKQASSCGSGGCGCH
jgi:putative FmdB family regulatory protein